MSAVDRTLAIQIEPTLEAALKEHLGVKDLAEAVGALITSRAADLGHSGAVAVALLPDRSREGQRLWDALFATPPEEFARLTKLNHPGR